MTDVIEQSSYLISLNQGAPFAAETPEAYVS